MRRPTALLAALLLVGTLAVVPVALTPAVGHAVRRGRRAAGRVRLLVVALALVVLAGMFDVTHRGGTLYGLAVVLAVGYALVVAVLGVPLALLGGAVDAG